MITPLFLYLHTVNSPSNINKDARININYDTLPNNTSGKITGLTVTVKTRSDWNLQLSAANEIDLENVLLTATSIRFVIDDQIYNLPIVSRSKFSNSFNNTSNNYYYFEVTPVVFQFTAATYSQLSSITGVTFLPYVQDEKYQYSDNNPLMSNALENRTSIYIQQSDRIGSSVSPTNLQDILSSSATPAQIQDSNYSSTGWSNARYEGSTTDAQSYKGVPPAITAKAFKGEVNPSSSADLSICSRSLLDRVTADLLFTGDLTVPSFEGFISTKYQLKDNAPSGVSVIPITGSGIPGTGVIEIGSILSIESSTEKLRVTGIKPGIGSTLTTIAVSRGYLGTTVDNLTQGKKIYTVKPLRIFKIDDTSAKIVNSSNSKIWVKDSKEILSTDEFGLVYSSSSICMT